MLVVLIFWPPLRREKAQTPSRDFETFYLDAPRTFQKLRCTPAQTLRTTIRASNTAKMAAEQRKLLGKLFELHSLAIRPLTSQPEQLMGEQMVHGIDGQAAKLKITDSKVCRSYLVGTCPHDLFTNTKQDLGPCPKVHSEALKNEYESADAEQKKRWNFEYDYMRDMQKHIDECNRRIDTAQRRLEKTPDEIRQTNTLVRILSMLVSQTSLLTTFKTVAADR
jgi:hypothetical protein